MYNTKIDAGDGESGLFYYDKYPIKYKTPLERDFLIYQSFRNDVLDISPYPIDVPYMKNGKRCRYEASFFVQIAMGAQRKPRRSLLIDIQPEAVWRTAWRENSEAYKAAMRFCREQEFRFAIYDESRIRHKAFENVYSLIPYRDIADEFSREEIRHILNDVRQRGYTTVEYILARYYSSYLYRPRGHRMLLHLMAQKILGFDLWCNNVLDEKLEIYCLESCIY